MQQLSVKLRLRDKHAAELNRQARAVNLVWNYCNDAQKHACQTRRAWRDKLLSYSALAAATARIGNIHVKIATRRKDFLHKQSARIVKEYGLVVVGELSPSRLAKTNMAKSVLDAGWAGFKHMLSYKAITHGGVCLEVNEAYRIRICSDRCGALGGPKGTADLGIRDWSCSECGAVHRRDANSAKVILRVGLHTLVGGTNG
jgi:putative transposase